MCDALQNLKRAFIPSCHAKQTKRKREYSWSNRDSALWKAKAIAGRTSLRVTVLALFYESVKRGTKTIRKSKKTTTTNWKNEVKPQPREKLKQYCAENVWNFIFMLEFSIFIEEQ